MGTNEFNIVINGKRPYVSAIIVILVFMMLLLLAIGYLFLLPATYSHASDEMKTAYLIQVVPSWLTKICLNAFYGLIILVPLYFFTKIKRKGKLIFAADKLILQTRHIDRSFLFNNIKKIKCSYNMNLWKKDVGAFIVFIYPRKGEIASFLLAHGNDVDQVVEHLEKVEQAELII